MPLDEAPKWRVARISKYERMSNNADTCRSHPHGSTTRCGRCDDLKTINLSGICTRCLDVEAVAKANERKA